MGRLHTSKRRTINQSKLRRPSAQHHIRCVPARRARAMLSLPTIAFGCNWARGGHRASSCLCSKQRCWARHLPCLPTPLCSNNGTAVLMQQRTRLRTSIVAALLPSRWEGRSMQMRDQLRLLTLLLRSLRRVNTTLEMHVLMESVGSDHNHTQRHARLEVERMGARVLEALPFTTPAWAAPQHRRVAHDPNHASADPHTLFCHI